MKRKIERHKIAALILLVITILIISLSFTPQLKPIVNKIYDKIVNPDQEGDRLLSDDRPRGGSEEGDGSSSSGGGGSGGSGGGSGEPSDVPTSNISYLGSKNYHTCVHTLLIQKCKEYLNPSQEMAYSEGPGYFKCYNKFASENQEELKINVPLRVVYNRCGYQPQLTEKEKCLKNMFIEMCLQNDLEYTEYNTIFGTLVCTDDGFYLESDYNLHEKYLEINVTQEMINNRCG